MLLLDFIRSTQNLKGTKVGCREGDCGACTILVGEIKNDALVYTSATSCLMAIGNAAGKHIVTIEGVNTDGLNFIQQAFVDEGAAQCGFCTPGFIVSLAGFCLNSGASGCNGTDAVNGNICRCTGYKSIERAIAKIELKLKESHNNDAISFAIGHNIIPAYFSTIKNMLTTLLLSSNGYLNTGNKDLKLLGGGTDLYVQQHTTMVEADIDFLLDKKNLKGIVQDGNTCIMGASVTVTDMLNSPVFIQHFPVLKKHIQLISSTPVRNMATIAGNFINASPIGDLTIFFLALDARLHLTDGETERTVALKHFYRGYKNLDKTPAEVLTSISFQLPAEGSLFNFEKVSKRTHLDIASVNTAIYLTVKDDVIVRAALSAGGVGPVPASLSVSAGFLQGKKISCALIEEVAEAAQKEIAPISDARGTATYKRLLLAQLIKAHFITLFPSLEIKKIVHSA